MCNISHRLITDYAPNAAIECSCLCCWCLLHGASWLEWHAGLNLGCSSFALGCKPATRPMFAQVCHELEMAQIALIMKQKLAMERVSQMRVGRSVCTGDAKGHAKTYCTE